MGNGPFGHQPSGIFNFEPPDHVTLVEPVPRRIRGVTGGATVIDSERAMLVHQSRRLPYYAFPREDVSTGGEPEPLVEGYVTVPWDDVDEWLEEDERVIVHPRDPYHRIDTFATSRQVRVSLEGQVLAESTDVKALFETGLPIRYYFPFRDVRLEHLVAERHRHPVRLQGHRHPLVGANRRRRPLRRRVDLRGGRGAAGRRGRAGPHLLLQRAHRHRGRRAGPGPPPDTLGPMSVPMRVDGDPDRLVPRPATFAVSYKATLATRLRTIRSRIRST